MPGVKPGVAQSLGQATGRYVLLRIGMDDSSCSGAKSSISSIGVLYDAKPAAPTLIEPIGGVAGVRVSPEFRLGSTDISNDYLRYKIQVCTDNACNSILRTVDQTVSQQGWLAQSQQAGTAYTGGVPTQIAIHQYQPAPLAAGTQYWWRGAAIDTGGTNQWSDWSGTAAFTTAPASASGISIGGGGVSINGGTTITTGN